MKYILAKEGSDAMPAPLISVIVPVYNVESYIHQCIDSILNQTFKNFELILIDDESPDNCPHICDKYAQKDPRIRVYHIKNDGVAHARNLGMYHAQGKYIAFCDSDDYWDTDFLMVMYDTIEKETADLVSCGSTEFNHTIHISRTPLSYRVEPIDFKDNMDYIMKYELLTVHKDYFIGIAVWNHLFKKDIITTHNIIFCTECENYGEDMAFVLAYSFYCKKYVTVPKALYYYRSHPESMMSQSANVVKVDSMNQISIFLKPYFDENTTTKQEKKRFAVLHFLLMVRQFSKLLSSSQMSEIDKYIQTIRNQNHFWKYTKKIKKSYQIFVKLFGKTDAKGIILFSNYWLHRNWKRYRIESAIYYKFIKPHKS